MYAASFAVRMQNDFFAINISDTYGRCYFCGEAGGKKGEN